MGWYKKISSKENLQQGDFFPKLLLPRLSFANTNTREAMVGGSVVDWNEGGFIVLTQSCDLEPENGRDIEDVVLAPVFSLKDFLRDNPGYLKDGKYNNLIHNKYVGIHILRAPNANIMGGHFLVVLMQKTYVVNHKMLESMRQQRGYTIRYRLQHPQLELFSQRFGALYSRVGLPEAFPGKEDSAQVKLTVAEINAELVN